MLVKFEYSKRMSLLKISRVAFNLKRLPTLLKCISASNNSILTQAAFKNYSQNQNSKWPNIGEELEAKIKEASKLEQVENSKLVK